MPNTCSGVLVPLIAGLTWVGDTLVRRPYATSIAVSCFPRTTAPERQRLPSCKRGCARSRENRRSGPMAATQSTTAIRSYRIYFRDARNSIAASHEVDLPSDDEARGLAALMLDERNASYSAEVWDRTRLVCAVRKAIKTTRREQNDRASGG